MDLIFVLLRYITWCAYQFLRFHIGLHVFLTLFLYYFGRSFRSSYTAATAAVAADGSTLLFVVTKNGRVQVEDLFLLLYI